MRQDGRCVHARHRYAGGASNGRVDVRETADQVRRVCTERVVAHFGDGGGGGAAYGGVDVAEHRDEVGGVRLDCGGGQAVEGSGRSVARGATVGAQLTQQCAH
eukprot:6062589-Pleurochrysis_carterae.AAC.2